MGCHLRLWEYLKSRQQDLSSSRNQKLLVDKDCPKLSQCKLVSQSDLQCNGISNVKFFSSTLDIVRKSIEIKSLLFCTRWSYLSWKLCPWFKNCSSILPDEPECETILLFPVVISNLLYNEKVKNGIKLPFLEELKEWFLFPCIPG